MSTPTRDRISQLKQAVSIAEEIEKLESRLKAVLNGSSVPAPVEAAPAPRKKRKGKRKMSAETIAKMKASQQARWAKKRK